MTASATAAAPIVTIFGGSGFIGRYIAQRMARRGWRVRVAVRRPNDALFVRTYGDVGQVEPIQANIRDDASTARAVAGATAVVNCVGILAEAGRQTFDAVSAAGAKRIADAAAAAGAERLVHISAIGADAGSDSAYARAKAEGEAAALAAFPAAIILRPSVVFGDGDGFLNRFAAMGRMSPVVPIVGGETRFQPVHVDDVAAAAEKAAAGEAAPGVYELGGPRAYAFRALVEMVMRLIRRRRLVVDMPVPFARLQAWGLSAMQTLSFGLFVNDLLTADQIRLLAKDNVVSEGAKGFADLGISPRTVESVAETYLATFRPHGQYDAITESAQGLPGV